MRVILRAAAAAVALALSAGASLAQPAGPYDGPYVRLEGGWNHLEDMSAAGSGTALNLNASPNEGYLVGGAAGWRFDDWRFEVNLDYRANSSGVRLNNGGPFGAALSGTAGGGNVNSFSAMVNAIYDFPVAWPYVTPYAGVGVGVVNVDVSNFTAGGMRIANSSDIGAALQPMLGLRHMFNDHAAVSLEYRYLDAFNLSFKDATNSRFNGSYKTHSVMLSFTWYFGGLPPPKDNLVVVLPENSGHVGAVVVHDTKGDQLLLNQAYSAAGGYKGTGAAQAVEVKPAEVKTIFGRALDAAPIPPASFVLYFVSDSDELTEESKANFEKVFAEMARRAAVEIVVTGHTDTVGSLAYNDALSLRRAAHVKDLLVARKIPANAISIVGRGKRELLVPTADQTPEERNRRVVITAR
jgi:outer membrane protein OmpA-like peptidoglycan-associated protein/opacity protein-like surface antigen